ncbi:MAG TPA: 4,5-DOPA dioxygenase extradiol, partial [Verrucomicrobiae bacterium]|nr:4,5-DOPA dioxygenase extradiol [Verrucomicrobiae bacterium]
NGATLDELDDAFAHVEALDQYDEGGAIVRMSAYERTFACGRVDHEFTADDLPEQARFLAGDHDPLIAYETLGPDALLSAPTPDHYLPLLYVIAQQREDEQVSFPVEGVDGGSVSMLTVQIG